jgi:hypothetical protein
LQADAFMRVPSKHKKKEDKEINFASLFSFLLFISLFTLIIFNSTVPALAANNNEKPSVVLIDGGEVYVQWVGDSNTSGNSHTFLQDYQIRIKGVDPEGKRIWIELSRGGISLKDAIVTKNSQFIYSQNSTEILNLTVDNIYAGSEKDGVLVRFSPVYQYLDPGLPKPEIPDKPLDNSSGNNSSGIPNPTVKAEGFNMPLFFLSLGAILFFMGLIARKLWKK